LGQTSPTGPSRGFRDTEAVPAGRRRPAVDPRRVPRASRSAPSDVAASLVRRSLRVVFTTTRCSVVRPSARSEDRPATSTGFAALSGFWPWCRHRPCLVGSPLLGFLAPSATSTRGIRITRACHTRHCPSSGFLTPTTVCSPSGLADTLGPLPLLGSPLAGPFGRSGRDALPRLLHPLTHGARQPRTLRNTRSQAPQAPRHLSPPALVPWPRFQDSQAPLRSTSSPDRRRGFHPRSSPHTLEPSAAGRTIPRRAGASGSSPDPGTNGPTGDP